MSEAALEREFECYVLVQEIEQIYSELQTLMSVDYLKAINGASGAINTLKALADLAVKSQSVELKEGLLHLREEMLELKEALVSAKEENFELKQKLKESLELSRTSVEKLILGENGLYHTAEGDGPFCTGCYDTKKQKVRVANGALLPGIPKHYRCPNCKAAYGLSF